MHPLKPTLKTEWISLLLIILAALLGIYLQSHLPARVPSHWNLAGEVDGYSSRSFGAWFMPVLAAGMYLLLLFVPYLDPKRERYGEFRKAYAVIRTSLVAFMVLTGALLGAAGLGRAVDVGTYMPVLVGALLVVIGSQLKDLKQNWFAGVRTPWALEDEAVWNATQYCASWTMMAGGLAIALMAFPLPGWIKLILSVVAIAGIVLIPIIYSYIAYSRRR